MTKYIAEIDNGRIEEINYQQYLWIAGELLKEHVVPIYSTTYAKKKYCDCKMGEIVRIKIENL